MAWGNHGKEHSPWDGQQVVDGFTTGHVINYAFFSDGRA